jgi:arylsulfatase A-like enzyme
MKKILLVALAFLFCLSGNADTKKTNIILIMVDDAGYGDFGCYGQKLFTTPNIDRMAASGMLFTQHYSGSTVCAPTRCSIMNGVHTGHAFVRGNREVQPEGQAPIPSDMITIPKLLRKAGYVTGMFGKWGLGAPKSSGDPMNQGWDEFFGYNCQRQAHTFYPKHLWHNSEKVMLNGKTYSHDLIQEKALQFIRDNEKKSFFAYLPLTIPHAAMQCPEEDVAPFRKKFPQFENKIGKYSHGSIIRNPVAAFAGMMTRMDRGIGQILDLLNELDIAENTLVLFTSDNGPHYEGGHQPGFFNSNGPLKGHKRDLYEGGIRVPLIAYWPGKIKSGSVSNHICAHWDLMPTFCELAKISEPNHTDGISYIPALKGKKQKKHAYLYWEFHSYGNAQAIRMGDWKGIRLKVKNNPNAPIQLFNLKKDIGETNNIADNHPDIIRRITKLFKTAHTPSERFPLFTNKK